MKQAILTICGLALCGLLSCRNPLGMPPGDVVGMEVGHGIR